MNMINNCRHWHYWMSPSPCFILDLKNSMMKVGISLLHSWVSWANVTQYLLHTHGLHFKFSSARTANSWQPWVENLKTKPFSVEWLYSNILNKFRNKHEVTENCHFTIGKNTFQLWWQNKDQILRSGLVREILCKASHKIKVKNIY